LITKNTRGILFAIGAALSISNVYVFSKLALNQIHLAQFGVYWFGFGIIWNLIYFFSFGKYKTFTTLTRANIRGLFIISVLEMFGTIFFFMAIKIVENPTVVSFLVNINPIFVVVLGILILKERFNTIEFLGMAITLAGAVIISMVGVTDAGSFFVDGAQYVVFSAVFYSLSILVAKNQIKSVDASYLAISRITLLFIVSLISLIFLGLPLIPSASSLINIGIGSVLGPFLGTVLGYMALKHIEMSKATMVRSVRSLFVLTGAYLYFGTLPSNWQIIGGVFTMIGVIMISFGKLKILQKRQNVNL
jgi:drug/metabolite transporter (DMT)-like permease